MLIVRAEQMALLAAESEARTEDRAVAHLQNCIPDSCAMLSDTELRHIIRWGRRRSRHYEIEREFDFFRYLNLMFMFGLQFDTNLKYPWAMQTLTSNAAPSERMDLLMNRAMMACAQMAESKSK
jgi:hypothetical protein